MKMSRIIQIQFFECLCELDKTFRSSRCLLRKWKALVVEKSRCYFLAFTENMYVHKQFIWFSWLARSYRTDFNFVILGHYRISSFKGLDILWIWISDSQQCTGDNGCLKRDVLSSLLFSLIVIKAVPIKLLGIPAIYKRRQPPIIQ